MISHPHILNANRDKGARGRCLIADDSRMVRRVASRIFRDLGFEVGEAGSASETVELCRVRMPKLLVLDWHIDRFDGLGVMKKVRALPGGEDVKVIFCTTERNPERIIEALQAGANEYIMKPFDSDIVEAKLILTGLLPPRHSMRPNAGLVLKADTGPVEFVPDAEPVAE